MNGPDDPLSVDDVLAAAREDYVTQAGATLARISALAGQLAGGDTAEQLEAIRQELHRLQGSAGTFGFPRISRQAAAASLVLKRWRSVAGGSDRESLLRHMVSAMLDDLAMPAGVPSRDRRRVLLDTSGDEAATDLAIAALAAGLVVERVFKGELTEALAEGVPLAVLTSADAERATPETIVAELVARRGASS